MMHELVCHPGCAPGPVRKVTASIAPTPHGCRAWFSLEGDLDRIRIPDHREAQRRDHLWKTTCFEIFWQAEGQSAYREFNLSPSSEWAAYDFDDFRLNARDAPVEALAIACAHSSDRLALSADIVCDLALPARVALNAIVEHHDGTLQYWALAFEDGPPEFHSAACRALHLPAP